MPSAEFRAAGIDNAVLDVKVHAGPDFHYEDIVDPESFYAREDLIYAAGGVAANILSAHALVSNHPSRLYACIGNDLNGARYEQQTPRDLGALQISDTPTGVVGVVLMDNGSSRFDYVNLGAGPEVSIPADEYDLPTSLIYADLIQARTGPLVPHIDRLLSKNRTLNGIWTLNLAGASRFEDAVKVYDSFEEAPDTLYGNEHEYAVLCNTSASQLTEEVLRNRFPKPRLIAVTRGNEGADIIFENDLIHVAPPSIDQSLVVDETGAGDCFHGVMMGLLSNLPYSRWTLADVVSAGKTAAQYAALVVQSPQNRLTKSA